MLDSSFISISSFQILLREIGSEEGVEEALRGDASQWQGRGRRIAELEAEVERLKKLSSHSNKMFDSRLNSPDDFALQPRDHGDGSSRQENLSRTGEQKDNKQFYEVALNT